jgi:RNA-binding protein
MPEQHDNSMQDLKPTVWIGKQGSTETMIEEIVSQLKKRRLIKVKWLQNTEVDPEAIAAAARARLVDVRGRTMVLADKGRAAPAAPAKGSAKPPAKITGKTPKKVTAKSAAGASVRAPERPAGRSAARAPDKKSVPSAKPRSTGSMTRAKK